MAFGQGAPLGNQYGVKAKIWTNAINQALSERLKNKMPALKELAHALIDKGLTGDLPALREIGDRIEGKAVQAVEVSGHNGSPIEINTNSLEYGKRVAFLLAQAAVLEGECEVLSDSRSHESTPYLGQGSVEIVDPAASQEVENGGD